ncbi:S-adenosyl-L-methionine-dependent methyltransferase [Abortiporus biennis]|nr:S-adenosyl-L-methionine-dependent methyltransferase [Abortiporus biennis]
MSGIVQEPLKAPFASAVANTISVVVLTGLSLVTYGYQQALTPLYGTAATQWNLNKVVWSACILGSFAPTLPIWPSVLFGGILLTGMPLSSYWVAAYTGRWGDVIWGPVITHLTVLAPVLYIGVALVKAVQQLPDENGVVSTASAQMITLPVCRMAIMTLQDVWPIIPFLRNRDENEIFRYAGYAAIVVWAFSPFFARRANQTKQDSMKSTVPKSLTPQKGKKQAKDKSLRSQPSKSQFQSSTEPQTKTTSRSIFSKGAWRLLALPLLPFSTVLFTPPTLIGKSLAEPFRHPSAPLRVLSSVRSQYSGVVLVGEVLPPSPEEAEAGNVTEPHSLRYLRAGHSLLGGVWIGDRVYRRDRAGPLSQDQSGTPLGDSVYGTFILQEAVRLVKKSNGGSRKTALTIGLGTGIASSALIQHGISTTIIEIDSAVYEAAQHYFGMKAPEPDQIFLEDARGWVGKRKRLLETPSTETSTSNEQPSLFDIVIHDCFSGGGVPGHIFTVGFWEDLKTIVHPEGVIAVNFAGKLGSESSRAIVLTLTKVFGQCRAFHDSMEELSEEKLSNEFINWVFFCTPSDNPIAFRPAIDSDYLNSFLRERVLSTFQNREVPLAKITGDVEEKDKQKYILTDDNNPLVEWQQKDALHHWKLMREVLPDVYWETY